jgi:hypothetical protein
MSMADDILENEMLKDHESAFVRNMRMKHQANPKFQMTEKQTKWFCDLFAKYGNDTKAAA